MMIDDPDFVRACFYAILASHAPVFVDQNYTLRRSVNRSCGADSLTGSVLALVTLEGHEFLRKRGKLAAFSFLYPVEGLVVRKPLLILAGHPA